MSKQPVTCWSYEIEYDPAKDMWDVRTGQGNNPAHYRDAFIHLHDACIWLAETLLRQARKASRKENDERQNL